jgi:hypothetical protein
MVIGPVTVKPPGDGSYNSALARKPVAEPFALEAKPPVIRTLPSGSKVAVWAARGVVMLFVRANVLVSGSYNSALAQTGQPA